MDRHPMTVDRHVNSTAQYLLKRRHKQGVFAMLYVCCFCTEFKIKVSGVKEIFILLDSSYKKGPLRRTSSKLE
jgi:hypothetical protein